MRQGVSQTSAFRDIFELADRAEAWGVDCVWLGEIHFTPIRSVISASLQVAGSIASRTRRLRVGTAVQVLPLNHPLRIAEEVATVDHISEGRFEFGIGRSGVVRTYDIYGVPYGESQARFREALEIIRLSWQGKPFSYEGQFIGSRMRRSCPVRIRCRIRRSAWPPPATRRFRRRAGWASPSSWGSAPRRSPICRLSSRRTGRPGVSRPSGHPSVYLRIPVYASTTEQGAVEEPRQSLTSFFARQTELARAAVGRAGAGPADRRRLQAERMASLSYEDILAKKVAFGTAAGVIDRLTQLREELGLDGIVAELNPGGRIPPELETRSLQILAREVMPAFKWSADDEPGAGAGGRAHRRHAAADDRALRREEAVPCTGARRAFSPPTSAACPAARS